MRNSRILISLCGSPYQNWEVSFRGFFEAWVCGHRNLKPTLQKEPVVCVFSTAAEANSESAPKWDTPRGGGQATGSLALQKSRLGLGGSALGGGERDGG